MIIQSYPAASGQLHTPPANTMRQFDLLMAMSKEAFVSVKRRFGRRVGRPAKYKPRLDLKYLDDTKEYTVKQVMKFTGRAESTVRQLLMRGRMKHRNDNGHTLVRGAAIRGYLAARQIPEEAGFAS